MLPLFVSSLLLAPPEGITNKGCASKVKPTSLLFFLHLNIFQLEVLFQKKHS